MSRTETTPRGSAPPRRHVARPLVALLAVVTALPLLLLLSTDAGAATTAPLSLGRAGQYLVLGGSAVTNTGPTTIGGNLGLSPGSSVSGFPPGTVSDPATIEAGTSATASAQADDADAMSQATSRAVDHTIVTELGTQHLGPGVHADTDKRALTLNGELTLDAGGDPSAVFIIRTDSTITTAANSSVRLVNGAQECHVYWQVGTSATLGASSSLSGNVMAQTSITVGDSVAIHGRLLAHDGAITLGNDVVSAPTCDVVPPTTQSPTTTATTTSPPPAACNTGGGGTPDSFGQPLPARPQPDHPTVQGRVTNATTGLSVPFATVRLLRVANGSSVTSAAQADADGRYAFASTGPGSFVVQFVAFGFTTTSSAPFALGGPVVVRDGVLNPAAPTPGAQGTVVDAATGRPLDGVAVRLWQYPNLFAYAATTTAGGGHYRFATIPAGTYQVQFAAPGYATVWHAAAPTRDTATIVDITTGPVTVNASMAGRCADVRPAR